MQAEDLGEWNKNTAYWIILELLITGDYFLLCVGRKEEENLLIMRQMKGAEQMKQGD